MPHIFGGRSLMRPSTWAHSADCLDLAIQPSVYVIEMSHFLSALDIARMDRYNQSELPCSAGIEVKFFLSITLAIAASFAHRMWGWWTGPAAIIPGDTSPSGLPRPKSPPGSTTTRTRRSRGHAILRCTAGSGSLRRERGASVAGSSHRDRG